MNLNLSLELGTLSENQRVALAAMIMDISPNPVGVIAGVAQVSETPELANEIAHLAREGGEFDASVAYAHGYAYDIVPPDDPAAAFGATPAPLPLGATPAPFIAVAVPPSTAPVVTLTSINPANGPAMPAPLPAPVAVAPSAPVVPLTPASGVELDKNGLPWDARIHGSTKTKNSDGTWRAKRGVDNALVLQVNSELRQLMGAPAAPLTHAPATATTPAPQAGHATMPTAGAAFSGVPAPAPDPYLAGIAPPPPPLHSAPVSGVASNTTAAPSVAPPDGRQLFVGLIGRASAALQANKLTQAEVGEICARYGVPALPLLANRLDLVPNIAAEVDALIAARP